MPKVIPGLQKSILTTAEKHFAAHGFAGTDMRAIASDVGVAIGTVYLHYENKEKLYLDVIDQRWNNKINKIESYTNQNEEPTLILRQVLQQLAAEIQDHSTESNLWMEIGSLHHQHKKNPAANIPHADKISQVATILSGILSRCAARNNSRTPVEIFDKLGNYAFIMVVDASMMDSKNIEENVDLIVDLLLAYINKSA